MQQTDEKFIKESIRALKECIDLQLSKGDDYQNSASDVKQAHYYPRGIESIYDMLNTKMLRIRSLLDKAQSGNVANHESLEDTLKDLINYASFGVEYLRGKMDGQDLSRNMFNKRDI